MHAAPVVIDVPEMFVMTATMLSVAIFGKLFHASEGWYPSTLSEQLFAIKHAAKLLQPKPPSKARENAMRAKKYVACARAQNGMCSGTTSAHWIHAIAHRL